jgi:hypothetical protein
LRPVGNTPVVDLTILALEEAVMAPGAGGKRKKVERSWSTDSTNDGQRPSPHRPGNLNMAQHNHGSQSPQSRGEQSDARGRLRRQPSRGGRNNTGQRPSNDNQNSTGGRRDSAMSPPELVGRDTPDQGRTNGTTPSGAQLRHSRRNSRLSLLRLRIRKCHQFLLLRHHQNRVRRINMTTLRMR